jgi:anti-sigma regulatory factor (Ser/Thr protein kinase)
VSAWLLARTARHEAPAEPRAIAQVRHEARKTLKDWQVGAVADAAELAVSEMLTNALHYGRIEILALELSLDEPWLCLSVADANPTPPYPCRVDEQVRGRPRGVPDGRARRRLGLSRHRHRQERVRRVPHPTHARRSRHPTVNTAVPAYGTGPLGTQQAARTL